MTTLGPTWERDDLPDGQVRLTQYLRRISYIGDDGIRRRIMPDWVDSGIPGRPHIVSAGPMIVSIGDDGLRRIHPTRDPLRYMEIGGVKTFIGGTWQLANFGTPTRIGNRLRWVTASVNQYLDFGGEDMKAAWLLKGGYTPPNMQFAFQVGLQGLTRAGTGIFADGVQVAKLRPPAVYDFANPRDVRPILNEFVQIGGNPHILFTLPSLAGMAQPLVDPTLTLQPAATAGVDTYTDSAAANTNYATDTSTYFSNLYTGLIKFDLSSIPAGSVVNSATLTIFRSNGNGTLTLAVYRILSANSAWTEAGATWNYALASTVRWAGDAGGDGGVDAGCTIAGTDYATTAMGTAAVASGDPVNTQYDIALTTSAVEAMIAANHGFAQRTNSAFYVSHWSSDYAVDATKRPKIVIVYTVPNAKPPTVLLPRMGRLGSI